jgi:hypothetical protein
MNLDIFLRSPIKLVDILNNYCCEDEEKMATTGSTIPRALAQRGCLGQHKS